MRVSSPKPKKFTDREERMMELAEKKKTRAFILEGGVAATFKTYGEWVSIHQAEISIEILREAAELRKVADRIMEQVNQTIRGRSKHGNR